MAKKMSKEMEWRTQGMIYALNIAKKDGVLPKDWKTYLKAGFDECMRVLEPDGILIFKWNEEQIKLNDVLKEFGKKPLLGDQRGKTRWIVFMK